MTSGQNIEDDFFGIDQNVESLVTYVIAPLLAVVLLVAPFIVLVRVWMHLTSAAFFVLCQYIATDYVLEEVNLVDKEQMNAQELSQFLLPLSSIKRHVNFVLCLVAACYTISWSLDLQKRSRFFKWLPLAYALPLLAKVKYLLDTFNLSHREAALIFHQLGCLVALLGAVFYILAIIPTIFSYLRGKVNVVGMTRRREGSTYLMMCSSPKQTV